MLSIEGVIPSSRGFHMQSVALNRITNYRVFSPFYLCQCCHRVAGYRLAWVGHFPFDKNRSATFKYPLWSLRGDYHMSLFRVMGRLRDRLRDVNVSDGLTLA